MRIAGFKSRANAFFLASSCFPFLFLHYKWAGIVGLGGTDRVLITLSQPCIIANFFNNNFNNNNALLILNEQSIYQFKVNNTSEKAVRALIN